MTPRLRHIESTPDTPTPKPPKPKLLGTELHHCFRCNREKPHEVFTHPDGVTLKCPCGYNFVDVRDTNGS